MMAVDHTKEVSKLSKFKFKTRVLSCGAGGWGLFKFGQVIEGKSVDNLFKFMYNLCISC